MGLILVICNAFTGDDLMNQVEIIEHTSVKPLARLPLISLGCAVLGGLAGYFASVAMLDLLASMPDLQTGGLPLAALQPVITMAVVIVSMLMFGLIALIIMPKEGQPNP